MSNVLTSWVRRRQGLLLYIRSLDHITRHDKIHSLPCFILLARRDMVVRTEMRSLCCGCHLDTRQQQSANEALDEGILLF